MCRYATKNYKNHFVCFECRKSFKKVTIDDMLIQNSDLNDYRNAFLNYNSEKSKKFRRVNPERVEFLTEKYNNRKVKCPDCENLMADLGKDFKAPKKDKIKEWAIIKSLYKSGKIFHTCGCNGIGYVPKNKKDYKKYLLDKLAYYELRLKNRDAIMNKENLSDYINRFTKSINLINQELKSLDKLI